MESTRLISELDPRQAVERELLLASARAAATERGQVLELVQIFGGTIVNVGPDAVTVSLEGHPDKLNDFEDLLRPFGLLELQRTGRIALPKLDRDGR